MTDKKVYLAIPTYDGRIGETILNRVIDAYKSPALGTLHISSGSMLTRNFNLLYAAALNARKKGFTHFLMMHEDIAVQATAESNWLDVFLAIAEREQADILSAIVPIKSPQGLTSTALDQPMNDKFDHKWRPRRLTLTEVFADYPPTFTHQDLLVNTGLLLVDMRKDWADKLYFEIENGIVEDPEHPGSLTAVCVPEDWHFTRQARALGARIFATRELAILHMGNAKYPNTAGWGTLKKDQ